MISDVIERIVVRLHQEPAFRQFFLAHPETVLSEHRVSDDERRALMRLHGRLALATPEGQVGRGPEAWWP
jgi:hypothetical protein